MNGSDTIPGRRRALPVQLGRLAYLLLLIGLIPLAPPRALATEIHVVSDTILRTFERDAGNGRTLKAAPAYEYLQLDYGKLTDTGLSLHAYGWERANLRDNYNKGDTAGEFLYGYLQYVPASRNYQVRAGRQYIFEGVARDSIDGVYGKAFLIPSVSVAAYAGSPTALENTSGMKGDFIGGGKLTHSRPNLYDVGVSYKFIANNGRRDEETLGADLALLLPRNISLFGHSAYNLVNNGWGEHSYELRIPRGQFEIRPFFQHFRYDDYFSAQSNSANPFRFLQGTGNALTVAGAEAFYYPAENWEWALRLKNYDYDKRFGTSQLVTLLATWKWRILSEVGGELGRMQGHEAENRYVLSRGYVLWNLAKGFVTGDIMYVNYDRAIYRKHGALFASIGGGSRFLNNALSVKLSFDYSNDAYFDEDFRTMLKISYVLDKTFKSRSRD